MRFDIRSLPTKLIRKYSRIIIFVLLIVVEIFLAANNWKDLQFEHIPSWYILLPFMVFFTGENAIKLWAVKSPRGKIAFYVFDVISLLVMTLFSDGALISTLYIIILSEFYLGQEKLGGSIAMGASCIVVLLITFAVSNALKNIDFNVISLVSSMFNDLILILLHFLIFNFTIQIYRKNQEMDKTLTELHEANQKLQEANRELQEITMLEERQRIAKDIHDTAGHSITTVIMQTEAAKLMIDSDPEDAKRKIAAANLQAKHALDELRESVHLLSGSQAQPTFKDQLMEIVHDSTDGTGVVIRADVEEITLCDAKRRFLVNSLKEGISNGLRHGNATAFYFECKEAGGRVEFLLSDNGAGLELSALKEGFGLFGMHKRAESLGGQVWFDTEPGEGFEIHITLPSDGIKGEQE